MAKKILLMYISEKSGHHQAAIALERAILAKAPETEILNINAFKYTNPVIEKIIHKAYMGIVKKRPEIWGNMYDNPSIVNKTRRIRQIIQNAGSRKMERLIKRFQPGAIGCTQAFPCCVISEYKKKGRDNIPLVGILTDYAPHSYWINEGVDIYIVPSVEVKGTFIKKGIPAKKIKALGTPIDPRFETALNKKRVRKKLGLPAKKPLILVMGGTHGIGPGEKLVKELDKSAADFQVAVITGVNKKLYRKINKFSRSSKKNIIAMKFVSNVHELMSAATIIISKPGGLTTAESLAKKLPMIILNPLPGQEGFNTTLLTEKGIALKAQDERDAVNLSEKLLNNPGRIRKIQRAMKANAKPHAAGDAAELLLNLAAS